VRTLLANLITITAGLATTGACAVELPQAIDAQGAVAALRVHAEGAQIYECKADAKGALVWGFREPVASLFLDGKTIGRHYVGPTWEIDGATIVGRAAGQAPGAGAKDIPLLKLEVTVRRGDSPQLKDVTLVQRLDTRGGALQGSCGRAGDLHAEPYAADYVFLRAAP
jgi:hypothetical protein